MRVATSGRSLIAVGALLLVYWALALGLLQAWQAQGANQPTGDEPFYMMMADGLLRHGTLEQSVPHADELAQRRYSPDGVPAFDAELPQITHMVAGPNGYYSVHNIGLPSLIAVPLALGGAAGAKMFLALLSGAIVLLAWALAGTFRLTLAQRLLATATVSLALPFLPGAGQVYPDIPGGLLCLFGLYWLATPERARSARRRLAYALVLALLPWLQIRFAAPALILVAALVWQTLERQPHDRRQALGIALPMVVSGLLLAAYNAWAYGNPFGPYSKDALEFSRTALLSLIGLHIDQNQGFLLQNPVHFFGLIGLGWLAMARRRLALVFVLVYLSLIVPNALHPAWYGGWSFSGRFAWAAATVFALPTLAGLARLAQGSPRVFVGVAVSAVALQLAFYAGYVGWLGDTSLYNRSPAGLTMPWLPNYGIFYAPVWEWFPAVYGQAPNGWLWALGYAPNVLFMALVAGAFALGVATARQTPRRFALSSVMAASLALAAVAWVGFAQSPVSAYQEPQRFQPGAYPGHTGRAQGDARMAQAGADAPALLMYGPAQRLHRGRYAVTFDYRSDAPVDAQVGTIDVYRQRDDDVVGTAAVPGSAGQPASVTYEFQVHSPQPHEFRLAWNGIGDFALLQVRVAPTESRP